VDRYHVVSTVAYKQVESLSEFLPSVFLFCRQVLPLMDSDEFVLLNVAEALLDDVWAGPKYAHQGRAGSP
jgi:hypothetical protein